MAYENDIIMRQVRDMTHACLQKFYLGKTPRPMNIRRGSSYSNGQFICPVDCAGRCRKNQ